MSVNKDTYKNLMKKLGGENEVHMRIVEVVLMLVFAVIEQFYVDENFKCPCFNEQTDKNCQKARSYSIVFIVMTTVGATFIGFVVLCAVKCVCKGKGAESESKDKNSGGEENEAASAAVIHDVKDEDIRIINHGPKTKENNSEKKGTEQVVTPTQGYWCCPYGCKGMYFCSKFVEGVLIGSAWFRILLLDGDYMACATVCNPYGNKSCMDIRGLKQNELPFTRPFATARRTSQYIGIGMIALVIVLIAMRKFCSCPGCCDSCCDCCQCTTKCPCCECFTCKYGDNDPEAAELLKYFVADATNAVKKAVGDIQSTPL